MFQLARQLLNPATPKVLVTATTHLGSWQASLADHHLIVGNNNDLQNEFENLSGVILITGGVFEDRIQPCPSETLSWLRKKSNNDQIPILLEADGSRAHPLKAPAQHEPPIPEFSDAVIHVSGLSGIGKLLNDENVHRPEIFSELSGLHMHTKVTADSITKMLKHPDGGLKNIPPGARRIAFLNQADNPALQSIGGGMASDLLEVFDSVVVGSLENQTFQTIEHTAGIILAAGSSTRFGSPKQLLDWKGKPFVRHIAETALRSGLWPVVVVTGAHHADIGSCLSDLPVKVIHNPNHEQGQSTSIKAGLQEISSKVGASVFLLADQPQIPEEVIRALVESHSRELAPILAPLVLEERRANPVLFDKVAFRDLMQLTGDIGGRAIFSKYKVEYLTWHDDILLLDVDKPEDYQRLTNIEKL